MDISKIDPVQYISANNVEIVSDGKFFALVNPQGTTEIKTLTGLPSDCEILNCFPNKYKISGVQYQCITIFTYASNLFKIWCYNTETTDLYELFQETVGGDYLTPDRVVDGKNYPENGVDILYFTDNYHEVRFLKCEIPNPYTSNFLNSYQLSLLRKGANGSISLVSIGSTGGSLLTGTYQFAYRMADPINKRFTKWSTLTNPYHIYSISNSNSQVFSGVGLSSTRKLNLIISPSEVELANFSYLQLAVVQNVGSASPTVANLLDILPTFGAAVSYSYRANTSIGSIPLTDITVDLAQIARVKTLSQKENRLFGGNIHYTELEFDSGDPAVTSGQILALTQSEADPYSNDYFSSNFIGHFREEVYRYGIVYSDIDGNKSQVKPFNFNGLITGNQITAGLPDVKFPGRDTSTSYTLLDSSGNPRALGLRLTNIHNHPSWAASFEIVRLPRKKNVLFQTPIVPMYQLNGVGALDRYPAKGQVPGVGGGVVDNDTPDAQPQTAGYTFVPKNLYWPELRDTTKTTEAGGSSWLSYLKGEVKLRQTYKFNYAMIFPPESMYTSNPFPFTKTEKMNVIDFALMRVDHTNFSEPPTVSPTPKTGDFIDTSVFGSFYATGDTQYYYDSATAGKTIDFRLKNISITDSEYFDNLQNGASVAGTTVLDYQAMQTSGGTVWGFQPNIQRNTVVRLQGATGLPFSVPYIYDPSFFDLTFKTGQLNKYTASGYVFGSSGLTYDSELRNQYLSEYAGFINKSSNVGAIMIGNVYQGLGDDRYGDINSTGEYISTGAKYTFSDFERSQLEAGNGSTLFVNMDVWGGDCYVGYQSFKVCDSTYSVMSQNKYYGEGRYTDYNATTWNRIYPIEGGDSNDAISIPVAVKNSAQFIQVLLESEYNGEVRDKDTAQMTTDIPVPHFYGANETDCRVPLSYKYNINLNIGNSQKIYVPKPQYSFVQNEFQARIVYSDLKIYNSDQAGFDIFRVGNFNDLEETRYGITKLAVAGDNLYAIQEQGTSYIPTGERQIEQTDAGSLSVRSGDVIGRTLLLDAKRGSQHLRGIVETGGAIYVPDNKNKSVYMIADNNLVPIVDNNETIFREIFANQIDEKDVVGIYDPVRRQYWLSHRDTTCQIYNEELNSWVSNYEFEDFKGGIFTNNKLWLLGNNTINTMYTGNTTQLFGTYVIPKVTFSINPDESFSKTFDDIMISATDRLNDLDIVVPRESSLGNQVINTVDLNVLSVEGNFRVKVLRDSSDARARGLRAVTTITWLDNVTSALQAVFCKYRLSSRTPF